MSPTTYASIDNAADSVQIGATGSGSPLVVPKVPTTFWPVTVPVAVTEAAVTAPVAATEAAVTEVVDTIAFPVIVPPDVIVPPVIVPGTVRLLTDNVGTLSVVAVIVEPMMLLARISAP
jgi:hypothetical protein